MTPCPKKRGKKRKHSAQTSREQATAIAHMEKLIAKDQREAAKLETLHRRRTEAIDAHRSVLAEFISVGNSTQLNAVRTHQKATAETVLQSEKRPALLRRSGRTATVPVRTSAAAAGCCHRSQLGISGIVLTASCMSLSLYLACVAAQAPAQEPKKRKPSLKPRGGSVQQLPASKKGGIVTQILCCSSRAQVAQRKRWLVRKDETGQVTFQNISKWLKRFHAWRDESEEHKTQDISRTDWTNVFRTANRPRQYGHHEDIIQVASILIRAARSISPCDCDYCARARICTCTGGQ